MDFQQIEKEWFEKLEKMKVFKKNETRAVHKPLLLLFMIARAFHGEEQWVQFAEIEQKLNPLLKEFGGPNSKSNLHYPFWRLRNDGFWILSNSENLQENSSGDVNKKDLLTHNVSGGIVDELWKPLCENRKLQQDLVTKLLAGFWPATLHQDIKDALGFPENFEQEELLQQRKRSSTFRKEVLIAYEKRCAICDYDGRISDNLLGLEAAHIRWFAYGGPNDLTNGIALCSFHHIALDRGALGFSNEYKIIVSSHMSGQIMLEELLYQFIGKQLNSPQYGKYPDKSYVDWHRKNVFIGDERKKIS